MVASRTWWWSLAAILAVGCANADTDVDSRELQAGLVCGMEVLPSPQTVPATACQNGRTVFGPSRFERTAGRSESDVSFDLDGANEVCITLTSSEKGKAHVSLDDEVVAIPDLFNDFGGGEQTADLSAGSHNLHIKMVGTPGEYVDVEVREAFAALDTGLDITNDDNSLRLTDVATDHPLLTPNGDGHHDDTFFDAWVEPLNELPGKDDGTVDYFLQWEFSIVDLDSCATLNTGIAGTTQVNSPTRVSTTWDGTDVFGNVIPDGTYAYVFDVTLVDEFGIDFGSIQSPAYGFIVDSAPADYDELPEYLGACNSAADPTNCRCPGSGGIPGSGDPNCSFGMVQHLMDGAGFPTGTQGNFDDPSVIDKSFITTTQDPSTGRYRVTVDLREVYAGGLVSQGAGVWDSEASLRQWVADMTGVPVSTGDSLFNFDYVQLGTSTAVKLLGKANHSFNHFLLDAMTNENGLITVDGVTTDLAAAFDGDANAPAAYSVNGRQGDECSHSGNVNGIDELRAKFCAYNTAVSVGSTTDLGVYALRASLFDIEFNGKTATQDELCLLNGIFSCGIRTVRVPADSLQIESTYYADDGGLATALRTDALLINDGAAISLATDRGDGADGVCSRAVATRDGLVVRIDSADGSVPETCLINGVIPF